MTSHVPDRSDPDPVARIVAELADVPRGPIDLDLKALDNEQIPLRAVGS